MNFVVFFVFDIGFIIAIIAIFGLMLAKGITEVVTMILAHYVPIMKTMIIISIIVAIIIGIYEAHELEEHKPGKILSAVSNSIYNALYIHPVILLTTHGALKFLDWFSDGFGVATMIFFGFLILIIYAIIITLILIIGLGAPILIKIFILSLDSPVSKLLLIIAGLGIAFVYYLILKKEPTYPFITEFV